MNNKAPARANVVVLKQILNLIPRGMISRLALETGVEVKSRTFSVVRHLSAMLFAQVSHAMGLNDVCDWLRLRVENYNGFVRQYFPKGHDFATITVARLREVEEEINHRPRNVLAYQSPNDLLDHLRAS